MQGGHVQAVRRTCLVTVDKRAATVCITATPVHQLQGAWDASAHAQITSSRASARPANNCALEQAALDTTTTSAISHFKASRLEACAPNLTHTQNCPLYNGTNVISTRRRLSTAPHSRPEWSNHSCFMACSTVAPTDLAPCGHAACSQARALDSMPCTGHGTGQRVMAADEQML